MPGHRRIATVGLPHAIGGTTLAIHQVYLELLRTIFMRYINMLPDQHSGGLGVGSSNLPAPTNKINNSFRHQLGTSTSGHLNIPTHAGASPYTSACGCSALRALLMLSGP